MFFVSLQLKLQGFRDIPGHSGTSVECRRLHHHLIVQICAGHQWCCDSPGIWGTLSDGNGTWRLVSN